MSDERFNSSETEGWLQGSLVEAEDKGEMHKKQAERIKLTLALFKEHPEIQAAFEVYVGVGYHTRR